MRFTEQNRITVGPVSEFFAKAFHFLIFGFITLVLLLGTGNFIYEIILFLLGGKNAKLIKQNIGLINVLGGVIGVSLFSYIAFYNYDFMIHSKVIYANSEEIYSKALNVPLSKLISFKIGHHRFFSVLYIYYLDGEKKRKVYGNLGFSNKEREDELRSFFAQRGIPDKSSKPFQTLFAKIKKIIT